VDETLISVTVAARKFSDCINRVRYQGMSFLLEKNGVPVARIVPVRPTLGADLEKLATTLRQTRQAAPSNPEDEDNPVNTTANNAQAEPDQPSPKPPKRPALNW
jgi:prevent-host-death family protein